MKKNKTMEEMMADNKQRLKDSPVEIITFEMEFMIDKTKSEKFIETLGEQLKETFEKEGIKFLWVSSRV